MAKNWTFLATIALTWSLCLAQNPSQAPSPSNIFNLCFDPAATLASSELPCLHLLLERSMGADCWPRSLRLHALPSGRNVFGPNPDCLERCRVTHELRCSRFGVTQWNDIDLFYVRACQWSRISSGEIVLRACTIFGGLHLSYSILQSAMGWNRAYLGTSNEVNRTTGRTRKSLYRLHHFQSFLVGVALAHLQSRCHCRHHEYGIELERNEHLLFPRIHQSVSFHVWCPKLNFFQCPSWFYWTNCLPNLCRNPSHFACQQHLRIPQCQRYLLEQPNLRSLKWRLLRTDKLVEEPNGRTERPNHVATNRNLHTSQ